MSVPIYQAVCRVISYQNMEWRAQGYFATEDEAYAYIAKRRESYRPLVRPTVEAKGEYIGEEYLQLGTPEGQAMAQYILEA